MTRKRFVTTLGGVLAVFLGGGYLMNQMPGGGPLNLPSDSVPSAQSTNGGTIPAAGTSEGVATAPSSETASAPEAATGATETQMKKEFDTAAADAAAEAEAAQQAAATSASGTEASGTTRSATSTGTLVTATLDTVLLSAIGTSVIAGQAPTGTTVTLIANDQELGSAVSDESGAWTMILDEAVAPGSYKLKLKAVGPDGGEPVVREVGETTVATPEVVASSETPAAEPQAQTAALPETPEAGAAAAATLTSEASLPATSDAAATAEADIAVPAPDTFDVASVPPDLAAPAASEILSAAPEAAQTATPETSAAPETTGATSETAATEPSAPEATPKAETAASAAEPATPATEPQAPASTMTETTAVAPPAESSADAGAATAEPSATTAPAASSSTGETQTADAGTADPALVDQAGEAADSLSGMFTDWLTATGDEAEQAAKSFSLTSATYRPVAQGKGVVTLSGRGPPNAEVRLFVDKVAVGVTKIAESGRWLADADHWVEAGAHSARAEIIGTDGAVIAGHDLAFTSPGLPAAVASAEPAAPAEVTEGAAAAPPVLLAIADVAYESMGPKKGRITVGGRAEPKSQVRVFADGAGIGATEASESGDWSLASDTWLEAGAHAIRAERVAANGEAAESTLTEFVRPPSEVEVAAAETPDATPSGETSQSAAAQPAEAATASPSSRVRLRKSRKARLAKLAHKRRLAAIAEARQARLAKARKVRLAKARGPKLKTVTVQRGNAAVRFKVPVGKRKRRVLGYLHLGGTGWYRVRRGDTLWRIANRCYGDGRRYRWIVAENPRTIRDPDLIFPKQRIFVP